jgi:DNA-binding PucR family transcriptional regulator
MKRQGLPELSRALKEVAGRDEIARALCRILRPVHDYDARTRSDLSRTLRVYVECGGNLATTADRLFLHRNSVTYRLQRIHDLSRIDPRDGRTRLLLLVAFTLADPSMLEPMPDEGEVG